jgi:hypothetical protein
LNPRQQKRYGLRLAKRQRRDWARAIRYGEVREYTDEDVFSREYHWNGRIFVWHSGLD